MIKMHRRATSKKRAAEAEKEIDMEDKEATPVEDVEGILPPAEPNKPTQQEKPTQPMEPNFLEMMRVMMEENREKMEKKMEETSKKMEEKLEDTNKKIDETSKRMEEKIEENNRTLREELRAVNQENMERLDKKMESLKEELRQKITENNETTNKKIEEEITTIERKITEADERWSQTEREVQDFKAEISTKVTNIEETNRRNLEEKQREKREEWERMQNQFTDKYDGIETAITSINSQVRQNQTDIEILQSRPMSIPSILTTENREWINFRLYQKRPMEFIARIEEYFTGHRSNCWSTNKKVLDESFKEMTDSWWMAIRDDVTDYQQFKRLFKAKYWSESTQNIARDNICHGRYDPNRGNTLTAYFLGKVCIAKHLEPKIPEECLVSKLSYHYDENIRRARQNSQIKTIQAMTELLETYEHEDYYIRSRRRNDRPELRYNNNYVNSNQYNGNNNNYHPTNRNNNNNDNHNSSHNHNPPNRNNYYNNNPHNGNSQRNQNPNNNNYPNNNRNYQPGNNNSRTYRPRVNYIRTEGGGSRRYQQRRNSFQEYREQPTSHEHNEYRNYVRERSSSLENQTRQPRNESHFENRIERQETDIAAGHIIDNAEHLNERRQ